MNGTSIKKMAFSLFLTWTGLLCSCTKGIPPAPVPEDVRKVMVVYMDGYNNLCWNLRENLDSLLANAPAKALGNRFKLLVYAHFSKNDYDYNTPTSPVLLDLYVNEYGVAVRDTVKNYPDNTVSSSAATLCKVLEDIRALYPAEEYGLVYSSHGTGWVPEEYYSTARTHARLLSADSSYPGEESEGMNLHPFFAPNPLVKSLGCSLWYHDGAQHTREIELYDLQDAFPMHFKYVILDACLMGGVETAFQLKDVTDYIIASSMEILADGIDYFNLPGRVFGISDSDLKGVCEDYFAKYEYCTVTLVNTSRLNGLASVCRDLFGKYRNEIAKVNASSVQGYFSIDGLGPRHWYYDLEDIMVKAGMNDEDHARLSDALSECILYKAATPYGVFKRFSIDNFCGLSMYLPNKGNEQLDAHYRKLEWNKATKLVPDSIAE